MWLHLNVPVESTTNAFNREDIPLQEKHVYSDAFSGLHAVTHLHYLRASLAFRSIWNITVEQNTSVKPMIKSLKFLTAWSSHTGAKIAPTGANGTVTLAQRELDQALVHLNWYINYY